MRIHRSFVVAGLILAACGQRQAAGQSTPAGIRADVTLAPVATCESLTQTVQDTAVRQMRSQMDAWKSSSVGVASPPGAGPAAGAAAAPASFSTTNVQVAGVDEADFVKNDGTRIFVLSGRNLFTVTSWPPQDLAVAGKLEIEGWPGSMFLEEDRVVVFSSIWSPPPYASTLPCPSNGCWFSWSTTKITVVDVSNLSSPTVASEIYLPGRSAGARRIGSSVRLVVGDDVRWPQGMRWWPAYDPAVYQSPDQFAAAIAALEDANEALIRSTPLDQWFPKGERKLPDGGTVNVGYRCTDFYVSNAPERLGLVTIATLDLAHPEAGVDRASIVGEPGTLYATPQRLYLASTHFWWWPMSGQRDWTYVHAFDISDPGKAAYIGSGGVEGWVGDQFAMDDSGGYLRIATSTLRLSADPSTPGRFRSELGSRLSILAPRPDDKGGTSLALVGGIDSLVAGERLFSTRFVGDKGYAVTFRYVDPLVTMDLSDPAHPKKVAELTLPGFSTYLEPIDEGHLLAIGSELPLDSQGRPDWSKRSLQLSLFDVTDLAKPVRTAQALVGTAWAYSEALWDHHAFNWYRPDPASPGLLAIPFSDWIQAPAGIPVWGSFVSDLRLFSVDPAAGIAPIGSLGLGDVFVQQGNGTWTWWYQPWVRRSVLATDQSGSTFVYAIADAGIRVAPLSQLGAPLGTALFARTTAP